MFQKGIVLKISVGESTSASSDLAEDWKATQVPALLFEFHPNDIYNADETGFFFSLFAKQDSGDDR